MSVTRVADILQFRNRFARSIHLERDFQNEALQDYIVTPQAKATFERLVQGLSSKSRQRAWRITSDYGTGKSSFALALAQLLTDRHQHLPRPLRQVVDFRRIDTGRPKLIPVLVTGSREPIAVALLRALQRAVAECRTRGSEPQILGRIRFLLTPATTPVSDAAVIEILEEANAYVCGTGKGTGLLVILDELGKFLEFAALHPDRQDIFFLQSLAEVASRSGKYPLFVVGLLHQGFNAYAEQLSQALQKEWEKVAGRFEELLFSQPLEQTTCLVANALNVRTTQLPKAFVTEAERDMARTLDLGWYGPAATRSVLQGTAAQLYPLHPTVLPALVRLFSRFGQNERSLFSFLLSDEPFGLREFSERPLRTAHFYRLHHLYDYVRAAFGSRLSVQSYRSHWNQIESVIESFPQENEGQLQILKTVALLNIIDMPSLLATDGALAVAVASNGLFNERQVNEAVRYLAREKGVLFHRGAAGGYCLWPHTSVNLERAYQEACKAIGTPQRISSFIQEGLETRPLVARRHYIETGNLRHFDVCYVPVADLQMLMAIESEAADGRIVVPLCETEEEVLKALAFARSEDLKQRPEMLFAVPKPLGALVGLVQECQRWQWISQNIPELNNDGYAAEEVSRQLVASRQILEKRIHSYVGLRQFTETMDLQWFHQGSLLPISSGRGLLSALSQICDKIYRAAPRVRNELVNRHVLSSAAAAARMRLIERILRFPTQPLLGMEPAKKPPEMSMYLSVLKQAALHREVDGTWAIVEPSLQDDPSNLRPVFQRITGLLEEKPDSRVRVSDLFTQLRRRPYGVRDGLAPLLLAVFTVLHEQDVAIYESGGFLRHLTGQDFMRLIKAPDTFEIQYCKIAGVRSVVLEKLLMLLNPERRRQNGSDILDVVRPLCSFAAQLPPYVQKTSAVSAEAGAVREALLRAKEPATLLFRQLPLACGVEPFDADMTPSPHRVKEFVERLRAGLDELRLVYQGLLDRIKKEIAAAFDRPGNFEQVRADLAATAGKILVAATEPRFKALCFRLSDHLLAEQEWLESLGSLICSKPPAKWIDMDAVMFHEELRQLAGRFRRVETTVFRGLEGRVAAAMRVAITSPDGMEVDRVVYVDAAEEAEVIKLEAKLFLFFRDHKRLGLAAASRAMRRCLEEHE